MLSLDRRDLFRLTAGAAVTTGAFSAAVTIAPDARAESGGPLPARQFRALWIASVENIDFPSRTGRSPEELRAEFEGWLDLARDLNLNAVISQIRPTADAFWPSPHEPWSAYLTGAQGEDPGYDVLEHQVRAAHERNLEFHAWFNPYRISMQDDVDALIPEHPARQHPDWVLSYGGKLFYDPGLPEVREFVQLAMMDAVERYDIDAVHFDDYFYPYPVEGEEVPDAETYARFGGGLSLADWRRRNVDDLVREMGERVHAAKPWVQFGISPFGIWRNSTSDPAGSKTTGSESYETISADSRRWVKERWIDYICPQIYWEIGNPAADYAELTRWWSDVVEGTDVALYIGQAVYKASSGAFTDPRELTRHLELNTTQPQVAGDAFYNATSMREDPGEAVPILARERYAHPAVIPTLETLGGEAPAAPTHLRTQRTSDGVRVRWHGRPHGATSYAIWRLPDADLSPERFEDGANLVATVRAKRGAAQEFTHVGADEGGWYTVTAYDRAWNQSEPASPRRA